jgi:hypothetical protein
MPLVRMALAFVCKKNYVHYSTVPNNNQLNS